MARNGDLRTSMRSRLPFLPCVLLLWSIGTHAQSVQKKHLFSSLGGGAGLLDLSTAVDSLGTSGTEVGTVRFAFGYAITDRLSLGFHYDRIGTDRHHGAVDRVRFTTYLLEATWRPWIGQRMAFELHGALGASIMALRAMDARLPYTSNGGAIAVGVRFIHMLSGTIGLFLATDHAYSSANSIALDNEMLRDADGTPISIEWTSSRLSTGLIVRF